MSTNLAAPNWGPPYRAAALAFDQHVSHLIRPLVAMLPSEDPGFDGVVFSATVRGPDQTSDAPFAQSVEFFLPLPEMRRYAQYDVTGQQLINSGFVLVNGERVGLELQSAEAEGRR